MPVRIIRSEIESETHRGLSVSGILVEAGGGKHRIHLLGALLRRGLEEGARCENHGRGGGCDEGEYSGHVGSLSGTMIGRAGKDEACATGVSAYHGRWVF